MKYTRSFKSEIDLLADGVRNEFDVITLMGLNSVLRTEQEHAKGPVSITFNYQNNQYSCPIDEQTVFDVHGASVPNPIGTGHVIVPHKAVLALEYDSKYH